MNKNILVMKSFFFICLLISLIGDSAEQISFSTDWGSGKRSFLESYENICKSKLEQSLIFDIASLVQRHVESFMDCKNDNSNLKHRR
ncbi:Hypothetical predicted protein [Mytilus galloprovincialis]|uniref:Adipokinetic hormone 1 n=1 Tax=Mytilus galloprovincialis TaxID=29158 RepID=A0A8B6GCD0_MYTGA|nr:Hypothetical predicted protein [Mytilus galloprovincialis]